MPPRLQLAILLGSWCELRRSDVDFDAGVLKVRRGAVWLKDQTLSGPPKTAAGSRNLAYPPSMDQVIRDHITDHAQWGQGRPAVPVHVRCADSAALVLQAVEQGQGGR